MILYDYEEVETKNNNDDEKMPQFEDASNDEVKCLVEGESLVVRRA
jgi:nitrogen fixation-related uncharacterized protein